jgi:hypothetical protein
MDGFVLDFRRIAWMALGQSSSTARQPIDLVAVACSLASAASSGWTPPSQFDRFFFICHSPKRALIFTSGPIASLA